MWEKLFSVVKNIDLLSFICEESCRCCGKTVRTEKERNSGIIVGETCRFPHVQVQLKTGPPGICLCTDCHSRLQKNSQSIWWLPLNSDTTGNTIDLLPVAAAGFYEGPLQKLIRRLKYDDDRLTVKDLGPLMGQAYEILCQSVSEFEEEPILVPVPLHFGRYRKRGYNQAELLAKELSKLHKLDLNRGILRRQRNTKPQFGLSKEDRPGNVAGAFISNQKARNRTIVLVDDVFTSGSTLTACAVSLLQAGAQRVSAVALARARYEMEETTKR